jgi:excisionase family DNA binding protein
MTVEVTVTNPAYWGERAAQLAQLLRSADTSAPSTIGDPTGRPPDAESLLVIADPSHWAGQPQELREVLALAEQASPMGTSELPPGGSAGAVPGSQERLTMTVEEAAAALGISQAFAYEAVTRNEIPHVRIGRRILIPRAALERLLGDTGTTGREEL